ncbi:toll/interleukin-1 receptor domain-containing protein [Paraburkholderia azotifigens]|uniref:Toll/interleukin-1 receptor domain-containing protein n=1 Tax=Paraburkholderia azotifigens TaxID=2057004 RepID=A0A5C6VGE5_9BURK|nr:toll/interleukin-1 receptor domain-containing protein [Paraburkholderia azotifigens]TXC83771.1 toll/interleukin-1 receptor domain-containing protein [Paraburkholderia azotifigens]
MEELDEFFWSDLLDYIDEGRVVAVTDNGLLPVSQDGQIFGFDALVATRLAERLRIGLSEIDGPPRLDDVVSRYLLQPRARKEDLYVRTSQVVRDLAIEPPQALLDLAAVRRLDLFVTLSFDGLLTRAIDVIRHGGEARTSVVTFSPNRADDLPGPRDRLNAPTVFHLLGRQSSAPEWVICDEDRLEFLHALQDDARRPKLLFDALRDDHLLLLGCRLPDWLARFFLRAAKNERLSARRETVEYLVDPQADRDPGLKAFLADFSPATRVVALDPTVFCAELRSRWEQRHPAGVASAASAPAVQRAVDGAVFISYSSQDAAAVHGIAQALDAAGIDVWFDRSQLQGGDDWERQIRRGLEASSLFIPVISRATQDPARRRDFFWREWMAADDRAAGMAPDEPFLVPVVIDDTPAYGGTVPDRFRRAQWMTLPGAQTTDAFISHVRGLYRQISSRSCRS